MLVRRSFQARPFNREPIERRDPIVLRILRFAHLLPGVAGAFSSYTLHDRGFFTANDARTGKEIYGRQRISAEASGFSASPWAYNGKIFALSEDGDTFVLAPGPEFKVLARNALGERTLATPAIAGNSLIIRTASKLVRIGRR